MDWKESLAALKNMGNIPEGEPDKGETPKKENKNQIKGDIHISIEKKGRNGKTATIIYGFDCDESLIEQLAADIKKKLGTGGSVRDGEILIQGERKKEVIDFFSQKGIRIKA